MTNRRRYPRTEISFPVECSFIPEQSYFYTVSKDVSMGGLQILSNKFLSRDRLLKININLIDSIVRLKAKVRWCNKKRISERYCAGLEFVEATNPQTRKLSGFLHTTSNGVNNIFSPKR